MAFFKHLGPHNALGQSTDDFKSPSILNIKNMTELTVLN